jgi:hypothetical protein
MPGLKVRARAALRPLRQRDFGLGVVHGVLLAGADTLLDPSLVLVTLVGLWTHSPLLLGLVAPLAQAGCFLPQLWVSGWLQSQPTSLGLFRAMAVVRTLCLLALAWMTLSADDAGFRLFWFYGLLMASQLAAGFSGLSFMNVVGKIVPDGQRGLFFAWRLAVGGVLAIAVSLWVKQLLGSNSPAAFPANFALMFLAAAVLGAAGMGAFAIVREPASAALAPRANLRAQVQQALRFVRSDSRYRDYLGLRLALVVAAMATPFFVIYATRQFLVSGAAIGTFLAVNVTASLLAYVIWGQVSTQAGNEAILQRSAVLGMLVLGLVLLAPWLTSLGSAALWFAIIFALVGVRDAGINVSIGALLLDLAPATWRPLYVGFTNTVVGVALLLSMVGGLVVATVGVEFLFVLALGSYALAAWLAWRTRLRSVGCQ